MSQRPNPRCSAKERGESPCVLAECLRRDVTVIIANDYRSESGAATVLHAHPDLLHVTYTIGGTGVCVVGDQSVQLLPGMAHIVYPNEPHLFLTDRKDPFHNVVIKARLDGAAFPEGLPRVIDCRGRETEAEKLFLDVVAVLNVPSSPSRDLRLSARWLDLFAFLLEVAGPIAAEVGVKAAPPDAFARVALALQTPPFAFPGLNALARAARMGRATFVSRFREATGMSPRQFCLEAKLSYARRRLQVRGVRLKDVAAECGFANSQNLLRACRVRDLAFRRAETRVSRRG